MSGRPFLFEDFALDPDRRELRRAGAPVPMGPQVFDLLLHLVRHPERVHSKDDLVATVWKGRIVSDSTLTSHVNAVRTALGDNGRDQRLIRTVSRKGVRFVGALREAETQPPPAAAPPVTAAGAPTERPSIAVLPFANIGGDAEQEYFADGVSEDVITLLSKWRWFFVIARNSSFVYKGRVLDVRAVGRELGVRYVLEGSVRRAADRIRLTAQLVDASTGGQIWAERYERRLTDIFDIQDELTRAVAAAIAPALADVEREASRRKRPEDMRAWDYCLRGAWHFNQFGAAESDKALESFRRAAELDPELPDAHVGMARVMFSRLAYGFDTDRAAMLKGSAEAARRAATLDAHNSQAFYVLALAAAHGGDPEAGAEHAQRAVELNPSFAGGFFALAISNSFAGRPREALAAIETALRLSPTDPQRFAWYAQRASALYLDGRYADAADSARRSIALGRFQTAFRVLAAASAQLGELDAARAAVSELLSFSAGERTIADAVRPFARAQDRERYAAGLRKAGLPG